MLTWEMQLVETFQSVANASLESLRGSTAEESNSHADDLQSSPFTGSRAAAAPGN